MSIITREVNSITIGQRPEDGYFNLTKMVKASGKQMNNYLRTSETKAFLEALSTETLQSVSVLVQVVKGGSSHIEQGTWAHPQVAIHCAQWCSPEFAVLVTKWVFEWMAQGKTPADRPEALPTEISTLIAETNDLYGQFERTINEVTPPLLLARQIGDRLLQLKAKIPHGNWEAFREANIQSPNNGQPMSSSTASLYQRIAKHWDMLQDVGALSIKEADRVFRKVEGIPLRPVPRRERSLPERPSSLEHQLSLLEKAMNLLDRVDRSIGLDEHQQAVMRHQVINLLTQGNYDRCIGEA